MLKPLKNIVSNYPIPTSLFAIYSLFLTFAFLITQDNFYVREDFYFLGYLQNKLVDPSLPLPISDRITFNPFFFILSFYFYLGFGISNISIWFLLVNSFHVANSFILYKILQIYFPHSKYRSFLLLFLPSLFLLSSQFHQTIFFVSAGGLLHSSLTFVTLSLLFYFRFFLKSQKISQLAWSLIFMILAFFAYDTAVLLPCYIFLDLLLFRKSEFQSSRTVKIFYLIIPCILLTFLLVRFSILSLKTDYGPFFMVLSQKISWTTMLDFMTFSFVYGFLKLFFPLTTFLPFWIKNLISLFIFVSLILFARSSSKLQRKILFFALFSITLSFGLFLPMTFAHELSPRYFYFPIFFSMFLFFVLLNSLFNSLSNRLHSKKIIITIFIFSIFLLLFHSFALFMRNQSYYIPYGKVFRHYIQTREKKYSFTSNIFGIQKTYQVKNWTFDAIDHYQKRQQQTPQKYQLK